MRRLFLSAAALLAMETGNAVAETAGSVGLSLANNEYPNGYDYDSYELEASIFHRITGPWAVQAEGRLEEVEYPVGSDDGNHLALHGLYAPNNYTLGLFVGQGELFSSTEVEFFGVEGAYRFANWTLSGSAIKGEVSADYDRYRFGAKYFVVDNFAVGGGYALTEYGNADWETWDIGAEFRFGSAPITLSAGYLAQEGDFVDVDAWQIGARWSFGTGDLREEDRTAALAAIDAYLGDLRRWD